jgi:hypothetical protein
VISFGTFRNAVRGSAGRPGVPQEFKFLTTAATRGKAVRCYHREGLAAAAQALTDGFSSASWRSPSAAGKARKARELFGVYVEMDRAAAQLFADANVKPVVKLGRAEVRADVDVVCFDPAGDLCPRVLLWDLTECSTRQAQIISAVSVVAVEQALGHGRVTAAEVWRLRSRERHVFTRNEALQMLDAAEAVAEAYDI